MKPTIIAIVGPSGSGKTHLSMQLEAEFNAFLIVSHTTRSKRPGEIEGRDHYYIGDARHISRRTMLSYTRFADYEYFALEDQVPPHQPCVYVVDERGLKYLKYKKAHKYNIISIRVEASPKTLLERGISESRCLRDVGREKLGDDFYDFVIDNNGTLEQFENLGRNIYKTIRKWLRK